MCQIYSSLKIYVLLHVSRCLVCKLNSLWPLLNEKLWKNVIIYKYLMPMIADILILGVTVFIMCSVYLNRGLRFILSYLRVFHNKSRSHLSATRVYCQVYFREICVFVFIEYGNEVIFSKGTPTNHSHAKPRSIQNVHKRSFWFSIRGVRNAHLL